MSEKQDASSGPLDGLVRQPIGTPNNIEVLLHCHTILAPHPRADAPAVRDALEMLCRLGAIEANRDGFATTRLGMAWVEALCRVPCPEQVFIDTDGQVLGPA